MSTQDWEIHREIQIPVLALLHILSQGTRAYCSEGGKKRKEKKSGFVGLSLN